MEFISDKQKLEYIKNEYEVLKDMVRANFLANVTLTAYREYLRGNLPAEKVKVIESDSFKSELIDLLGGMEELSNNYVAFAHNLGLVFDEQFGDTLPTTIEQAGVLAKQLRESFMQRMVNDIDEQSMADWLTEKDED